MKHIEFTFRKDDYLPKQVSELKNPDKKSVKLDFSLISFFNPIDVVFARCVIEHCLQNSIQVDLKHTDDEFPKSDGPLAYANRMGLFNNMDVTFDFQKHQGPKFTEVLKIDHDEGYEIGQQIQRILEHANVPANVIFELVDMFSEVCNNAFYHSGPQENTGWGCMHAQVYKKEIQLAVCDLGVGVYESYRRMGQLKGRDEKILLHDIFNLLDSSLNQGTGRDRRGRGLNEVNKFLSNFGGYLKLFSGSHWVRVQDGKKEVFEAKEPFYGTMVDIRIPLP